MVKKNSKHLLMCWNGDSKTDIELVWQKNLEAQWQQEFARIWNLNRESALPKNTRGSLSSMFSKSEKKNKTIFNSVLSSELDKSRSWRNFIFDRGRHESINSLIARRLRK